MKMVYVGFVLLCTIALAFASGGTPTNSQSNQAAHQSGQSSDGQVTAPAPSQSDQGASVFSSTEADSLRVQGDSLLTHSRIGDIRVGSSEGGGLIYILVVVILVLVILKIAL